jgi:hypothetical protein
MNTPSGQVFPLMPNQFSGTVTIGGQPATDGTFVEARVMWWRSDTTQSEGKVWNGSYNIISVKPNDWALEGEIITFHIGDLQAEQTSRYNGRAFLVSTINLTFP